MVRLALLVVVVGGAALAVGCSPCVSGAPADALPRLTLADGGMGNACESTAQCTAGLECRDAFAVTDTYAELATFKTCTRDCSASACPAGFLCTAARGGAAGDGGAALICVPACQTDADCRTGQRAGSCVLPADAGTAAGTCQPVVCGGTSGGSCPSAYLCQDDVYGGRGGCYPNNSGAAMAAPQAAWCGRAN
jgi:hypothetical protein